MGLVEVENKKLRSDDCAEFRKKQVKGVDIINWYSRFTS